MSILVACPDCKARVTAPDSAAGKRVKCPDCQCVMILPEVDDPPRKRPAPRHDEDDDRPRKKKEKKKAASRGFLNHPIVLIVGGLLGVGVAAGGLYLYWEMKKKNAEVVEIDTKAPFTPPPGFAPAVPDGWTQTTVSNSRITVVAPVALVAVAVPQAAIDLKAGTPVCWQATHNGKTYQVIVVTDPKLPAGGAPPDDILDHLADDLLEGAQIKDRKTLIVGNAKARHCTYTHDGKHGVLRVAFAVGQFYFVSVFASTPFLDTDRDVAPFLDAAKLQPF